MKKTAKFWIPLMLILVMVAPQTVTTAHAANHEVTVTVTYRQTEARKMQSLINSFRTGTETWYWNADNQTRTQLTGLGQFTYDYNLEKIAMQRAAELVQSYGHTRPDGSNYSTIYSEMGYSASCVGENIAYGRNSLTTAQEMMENFKETDKDYAGQNHRRNLLDTDYNAVGCACVFYNGTFYWVQEFARTNSSSTATVASDDTTAVSVRANLDATAAVDTNNTYRISGDSNAVTSINTAKVLKSKLGVSKFNAIIVASANCYADALSGAYLAGKCDAPILMVDTSDMYSSDTVSIIDYIKQNLTTGGTVYILGGTAAISERFDNAMPTGACVKRLAGPTRFETNLAILQEAGATTEALLICSGINYPDALSASATGKPILLAGASLTAEQKSYLNQNQASRYYIIGGTAAVNTGVENELRTYGKTVNRLCGETRHETSIRVAETFWSGTVSTVALASSQDFAGGLLAAPLAQAMNIPLILTCNDNSTVAIAYCQRMNVAHAVVVGNSNNISDALVANCLG